MTRPSRTMQVRRYLMCPPSHFTVCYAINPWMDPAVPVDAERAMGQWEGLRQALRGLGHSVATIAARPGLPDMVFAANGATVIDGRVLGARFRHPQRQPEAAAYLAWFREHGYDASDVREARVVNEGEGDFALAGRTVLAGHGFRSHQAAAAEVSAVFGLPAVSLRLTDPRFYHLDTALVVLDADTVAYYPPAFDEGSKAALASLFAELIEVKDDDAQVLGLNAVSDGRNVVLPVQATGFAGQLEAAGFRPVGVDMSELMKAGGGPKCCTLELR